MPTQVTIDYVPIGYAGNAVDPATGSRYGAVSYAYKIAKNETTIADYAEFLNAVAKTDAYPLYTRSMTTSYINGFSRSGIVRELRIHSESRQRKKADHLCELV